MSSLSSIKESIVTACFNRSRPAETLNSPVKTLSIKERIKMAFFSISKFFETLSIKDSIGTALFNMSRSIEELSIKDSIVTALFNRSRPVEKAQDAQNAAQNAVKKVN